MKEEYKRYSFNSFEYLDKEDLDNARIYKETQESVLLYKIIDEEYYIYWGVNDKESLFKLLIIFINDKPDRNIYIQFIPGMFIDNMGKLGFRVVSEFKDFWKKDIKKEKLCRSNIDFTIRKMRSNECSGVSEITKACAGQSRGFEGESVEYMRQWSCTENSQIFVVEDSTKLVGVSLVKIYGNDKDNETCLWVRLLAVHPQYQRKGIGRALLNYCLAWGQEQGVSKSFLHADVENDQAIQLYIDHGYVTTECRGQINMKSFGKNNEPS